MHRRLLALLAPIALAACVGQEAPVPPELVTVKPFQGMLYLTWYTPDACDNVTIERKDENDPVFATVFMLGGTETSKIDPGASLDLMYTYRLLCTFNGATSDPGNEVSANPTQGL